MRLKSLLTIVLAVAVMCFAMAAGAEDLAVPAPATDYNAWIMGVSVALLGFSELIALTPLKSNSVVQLIFNILRQITGRT